MLTPKPIQVGVHPRHQIFVSTFLALALALAGLAGAARADLGRWSPNRDWSEQEQARYAVHMMLLRGDNAPYHSRILWWQGEGSIASQDSLFGGEWGWNPLPDTCTCATYPDPNFDRLGLNHSGMSPFCSGTAMLDGSRGRVLVAGGNDPVVDDYGENTAVVYTDGTGTARGTWSSLLTLSSRRFYPTATTLRDGRVMVVSGSQQKQHRIFGGLSADSALVDEGLHRFAPIPNGSWDPSVFPDADPQGGGKPVPRYGHTAVQMEYIQPFGGHVYFAGRNASGNPLQDTWLQQLTDGYPYDRDADGHYSWVVPRPLSGGPPPPRSDHSAIVALGNSMVVFGGRRSNGTGLDDVWRFYYDSGSYHWAPVATLTPPGVDPPLARYGYAAIYDETTDTNSATLRRMIVFGGTPGDGQDPVDSGVWELRFDSNPNTATWYPMTQIAVNAGDGTPSPRYWHTMNADASSRSRPGSPPDPAYANSHVALMYGGKLASGGFSGDLWKLWILRDHRVAWEKVPASGTPPGARARHSTVLDPEQSGYGARLYVYGGITAGGDANDIVYVLDPWGRNFPTWTPWNALGVHLAGHTSVLEHDPRIARAAEVFDPSTWAFAPYDSATLYEEFYPPQFLVPGGGGGSSRVINLGASGTQAYSLDIPPAGQAATESWSRLSNGATGFYPPTGVQYLPGHIMVTGGGDNTLSGLTRTLDTSDLTNNSWMNAGSMAARFHENLVLVPTGQVLAVGGNQADVNASPMKWPQLWTPAPNGTGVWTDTLDADTRLEKQPTMRGNHSTAILLPDGRVLSAGGDDSDTLGSDEHMANIFCPPYLFQSNRTDLASRPSFSNPARPESLGFGQLFTVCVPDTVGLTRACLIRPGATTHSVDMNERYVPLAFTEVGNPIRLLVTSPASPDSAPPGDYMLFLTGHHSGSTEYRDVPSIAQWVRIVAPGRDLCDGVAPQAIADLTWDVDPDDCTLFHLYWTAPADDGGLVTSGPALQYEIKLSSSSIPTSWSTGGTSLSLAPGTLGAQQTTTVTVAADKHRYIRIKTRDDNNNWSVASNQIYISGPPLGSDCLGGGGSFAGGGGGGGGFRAQPGAGLASLQATTLVAAAENSMLNGVAAGTRAGDLLRVSPGIASGGTVYLARLREASGHALALDRARLLTVDHSSSVTSFIASGRPVLGRRVAPVRALDGAGADVTGLLDGSTVNGFVGDSGAVVLIQLGTDTTATPDPVVIEASGLGWSSSGILLQTPDGAGGWRTLACVHPRIYFSELAVDSVPSARIRLYLLGRHQVRFVGRVARSSERPTVEWIPPLSAQDARAGDALAALIAADTVSVTLAGPDTLALSFAAPPLAAGQVRDWFLAVDATPLASGSLPAPSMRVSEADALPARFALWQNQPNPFGASTRIRFDLPVGAMVKLDVFDVQGRRVKVVANHYYPAGYQAVQWDGRDESGVTARPSVYLYRLTAGAFRAQKKMVLLP